ncbi:MAG: FAD-binding oxidoreductase [Candidatus Eisenbacteria bacterium]|uniref:FAD-binding oxidoreductase n=1 Tax=Eiseniibacteriota bacterium TaxID=2212470 RepID=A0A538T5B4_UNCEI|nr:MAG: FAD-binding oxidoreductase [Candidatus Eisenbacteria bacterium]
MSARQTTDDTRIESIRIGPGDPRYLAVVDKRFNKRFRASPDYVRLVCSTDQVVSAVEEALMQGRRLAVTSGGHCLEGFVSDAGVRVIIDVSPMKRVYYDAERGAVAVEAGATVGETFRALFETWGVVIPLGEYPEIGMGGHVSGGAFGFLCRQLGLAADYLYAVEVVTVDEGGRASGVVATRETSDPHRDLWWAHTGGGGGNFGVVTRYWFRSPEASGEDPAGLLPRAPESITTFKAEWSWSDMDEPAFLRLLRNHGVWCERNSNADSPNASLWTLFEIHRKQLGKIVVRGVTTAGAAAERQVDDHLAALSEGVLAPHGRELARMSWLEFALNPFPDLFAAPPGGVSVKVKDALLKKRLTDRQIGVAYDYLTRTDHDVMGGMLGLATYGGRINTVAPDATASAHRDSILDMACTTGWLNPREEEKNLRWVRAFYRDLLAESGGVPVPSEAYDGAFINHPDTDLPDPVLNTSGVPWHTLYYKANYPRLQRIKARWDPRDVFRHALSIRP